MTVLIELFDNEAEEQLVEGIVVNTSEFCFVASAINVNSKKTMS